MKAKRKRIIKLTKRQGGLCFFCGLPMRLTPPLTSGMSATLDHLEPKNGKPRPAVAAHRLCNNGRHHELITRLDIVARIKRSLTQDECNRVEWLKERDRALSEGPFFW